MIEVTEVAENKRTIKFDDKTVTLNRDESNSLWTFSWNSGEPPMVLSGSFTNTGVAIEFLKNYLDGLATSSQPKKKTVIKES